MIPIYGTIRVMIENLTTVKTASKDILARAMAREDINVEHRADAQTAYFDTNQRTLCLPVWKDMSNALYDMLVGHEISHALHTPAEGWADWVGTGPNAQMRHMFLNVTEDARIERMVKEEFPGIRRDFAQAYKELLDRDLFELKDKTIKDLPLIDRLNLQFKLGLFGYIDVPFTSDEQVYVDRMATTKTFEEVMELAADLLIDEKQNQPEQQPEEDEEGDNSSDSDGDDEDGNGIGFSVDQGDEEGGNGAGSDDNDNDGQEEDSGMSMEDDTDDGESADSTDGEGGQDGDGPSDLSYDSYSNDPMTAGSTQRAFEKGVEDLREDDAKRVQYVTLPTTNLDNIIVTPKQIEGLWEDSNRKVIELEKERNIDDQSHRNDSRRESNSNLQKFLNNSRPTVNHMVQQFQMKQAADADKRTDIAKTGILDTTTMINYRWSEDIFLKNEVHADGKSHGIVMFLDWSSSMHSIIKDTVEQLIVLVEFCKRAGIPYEVYAFSSNISELLYTETNDQYGNPVRITSNQFNRDDKQDCSPHDFCLYNFLSSKMNNQQFKTALSNLYYQVSVGYNWQSTVPRCLDLGCTPLNEAVLCAMDIIPQFQKAHGVQVVNATFLTDGEGHGMLGRGGYYAGDCIVRDKKSKRTYKVNGNGRFAETDTLLRMLKDKTGCTTIGIRLHDSHQLKSLRYSFWNNWNDENVNKDFEVACRSYKKDKFCTTDSDGYDEMFIVQGNLKVEFDGLDGLEDDASMTRIKNAFIKGNSSKKSSRVVAGRIIDIFCETH